MAVAAERVTQQVSAQVGSLLGELTTAGGIAVVAGGAVLAYLVTRFGLLRVLASLVARTDTDWDDRFLRRQVPHRLGLVPAAVVAEIGIGQVTGLAEAATTTVQRLSLVVIVASSVWALFGSLDAVNDLYERHEYARSRPIKGYLQLVKLVVVIIGGVLAVAVLINRSPLLLLSGLGAATVVLVLVFRDTILSLVASVQLAANDMVRVGDWITIDSMQVDGDVLDIALHTVTIRNFDLTFAFVPTHLLITEPFRNWRGMQDAGGRRIMRAVHLDVSSVRFLTDADRDRYAEWPLLDGALDDATTNLAAFRAYTLAWLRTRDDLHVDNAFPMMVRLREPTPSGQPVEVYAFSKITEWAPFEAVQAAVFDHLHAILASFDLRAFQYPSSGGARTGPPPPVHRDLP